MVMGNWSVAILFWQLSIDHIVNVLYICGLAKTRLSHPSLPFDSLSYPTRTIMRTYVSSVNHVTTKRKEVDHIECFHMTSRRPYWCPKTMKRRPCWCPKPVPWELYSFLMQMLSFVPINLHRCWPREWKHSIPWVWGSVQRALRARGSPAIKL